MAHVLESFRRVFADLWRNLRDNPYQAAALLIACAAAWPLLSEPGLLNSSRGGGDSPFLLQRLHQLESALRDGHFPVRWMPDANYGFGYPFFNYYAPLSFYIASIFRLIGFSFVRSIQLAQLLGFIMAAVAMYHLAKRWLNSKPAGFLAAIAYTLAPFHMVNVYVRGDSIAEFWAMAFYPLILLSVDELFTVDRIRGTGRAIGLFASSYAALILSHNISALIFSPFLVLYILLRWWSVASTPQPESPQPITHTEKNAPKPMKALVFSLVGILLAFALGAHFFVPALVEKESAQLDPVTTGYFYYGNHFLDADLVQPTLLFDYDPNGGRAFRVGLVQAILAFAGTLALIVRGGWSPAGKPDESTARPIHLFQSPGILFTLTTAIISTFMITPLSWPLWEHVPLLPFTQFPWRFLSVQAVGLALLTAGLTLLPGRRWLLPAATLLLLTSSLGRLETAYLYLTDADITAERLAQYEWFTGNIGTTISAEYLPNTVEPRAYSSAWLTYGEREHLLALSGELANGEQVNRRATRQTWQVTVDPDEDAPFATLGFPTMYWPGWTASIDGEEVEIRPASGSGLITVDVPAGRHTVELRLGHTAIRLLAELVSLAALLLLVWLLKPQWRLARSHGYLVLSLVFLALLLRTLPTRQWSPGNLSWDFAQMGYLHHAPEGILFDNGAVLESYSIDSDEVVPGETLTVSLKWRDALSPPVPRATLALFSPAVNRFKEAPAIARETINIQSGQSDYRLPIPVNAPAGLYVPRLTLDSGQAMMSANRLRGDLFLRPVRVRQEPAQVDEADEGQAFAVKAIDVQPRDTRTLDLQLAWLTRQPLGQNYRVTLRLVDANGLLLTQFDTQPGYGFSPSTSWPPGQWVNDWLAVALPQPIPENYPHGLVAQLYDVHTGNILLTRLLGDLVGQDDGLAFSPPEPEFSLSDDIVPLSAVFDAGSGPMIRLYGYDLVQGQDRLDLTLVWQALAAVPEDYSRFVHLVDPASNRPPMVQSDGMPRNNSYPTGQWTAGEVISEQVTLDIAGLPAGKYQLKIGLYRNLGDSFPRLAVADLDGQPYLADSVPLPVTIVVD